MENKLSTTAKGDLGVLYTSADLISKGYTVLSPLGGQPHYDLVIEKNNIFRKVQVKYAHIKNGVIQVKLYTVGHNGKVNLHTKDNVDIVAVYVPETDIVYYINQDQVDCETQVSLRVNPAKNNMKEHIRLAKDYMRV